ncbi:hypothetical protein AB0D11_29325 [Streptomyces monashensis]|uniref:hypothetical protein n=1 Tax=Streptomyces monashensis TaxID=1678012 RepID=UPI0033F26C1F
MDDWVSYVRAVATRYAGRITVYELWVLAPSPHFFTGDAAAAIRQAGPRPRPPVRPSASWGSRFTAVPPGRRAAEPRTGTAAMPAGRGARHALPLSGTGACPSSEPTCRVGDM